MTFEHYLQQFPTGVPEPFWKYAVIHQDQWEDVVKFARHNQLTWPSDFQLSMRDAEKVFSAGPFTALFLENGRYSRLAGGYDTAENVLARILELDATIMPWGYALVTRHEMPAMPF